MIDWMLFVVIFILQGLDVYTTHWVLMKSGNIEANKFLARLMSVLGVLPALLITKAVFLAVLGAAIAYAQAQPGYGAGSISVLTVALVVIWAGYAAVVFNNFRRM